MKKLTLTLLALVCALSCVFGLVACDSHQHSLTLVPQKEASCTEEGAKSAYYICSDCDKWYSDENGKNEIKDKSSVVLPRLQHTYSDGVCTLCNGKEPTQGLRYMIRGDFVELVGSSLTVNDGISEIVIADYYEGLPVKHIGRDAFKNNTFIISVTMPDTVTLINSSAFSGCEYMTSITLSKNLKSILSFAFNNCKRLESISIPYGVDTIWGGTFEGCAKLPYVALPDSVTKIESNTGLGNAIIPTSVTEIWEQGLKLGSINYYKGTAADWAKIKISSDNNLWTDDVHFYSETQPTDDGKYWHYDTDGVTPVIWSAE